MQLSGTHLTQAASTKVWRVLMDPAALSRIIPAISKLEPLGENAFRSFSEINIGPVNSAFTGNLRLENIVEEKEFTLLLQQNGKVGNANANIHVVLTGINGHSSELNFDGEVRLSGLMATIGNRVISGISNMLTKQFFTNLDQELNHSQ